MALIESFLENYDQKNGVYICSEIKAEFESVYLKVRLKEERIYSDEELMRLPFASNSNPLKNEWKLRAKSFSRFANYLSSKKDGLYILDLGCGNGWFCGQLSKSFKNNFYCVDVNFKELEQGKRVFTSHNLIFIYADIFSAELSKKKFDLIMINAAIQYFPDLSQLINKLKTLLVDGGEIHIIDSPFYSDEEIAFAKQRSIDYYTSLGFPEMSVNYFHHRWNELRNFKYEKIFNPITILNKFKKIFVNDSPFPWIRIIK